MERKVGIVTGRQTISQCSNGTGDGNHVSRQENDTGWESFTPTLLDRKGTENNGNFKEVYNNIRTGRERKMNVFTGRVIICAQHLNGADGNPARPVPVF